MKKITLPEKAFSHKKAHVICGHRFVDGSIIVSNDADKTVKMFKQFYGAEIEDIPEAVETEEVDESGDAALTASSTKGGQENT